MWHVIKGQGNASGPHVVQPGVVNFRKYLAHAAQTEVKILIVDQFFLRIYATAKKQAVFAINTKPGQQAACIRSTLPLRQDFPFQIVTQRFRGDNPR